jgi:hypothetical protein
MLASLTRAFAPLLVCGLFIASCSVQTGSGVPDWAVCSANGDCTLASSGCCPGCGAQTLADVDGVNKHDLAVHIHDVCPQPAYCPKCATASNPNLLATCSAGACVAVDVRQESATACTADADCRLRTTGCCECGGSLAPNELIAINTGKEAAYEALLCDAHTVCPDCGPIYPTTVQAFCAPNGHCAVRTVQ